MNPFLPGDPVSVFSVIGRLMLSGEAFLAGLKKRCKEEIVFFSRFYMLSKGIICRLRLVCCIHGLVSVMLFSGLSTP